MIFSYIYYIYFYFFHVCVCVCVKHLIERNIERLLFIYLFKLFHIFKAYHARHNLRLHHIIFFYVKLLKCRRFRVIRLFIYLGMFYIYTKGFKNKIK